MHNITGWMSSVIFVPLCRYLQSITLYIIFLHNAYLVQVVPCLIEVPAEILPTTCETYMKAFTILSPELSVLLSLLQQEPGSTLS